MSTSSLALRTLFENSTLTKSQILLILEKARHLKSGQLVSNKTKSSGLVLANVFFEPSTRTRFSFEMAAHRLGMRSLAFQADNSTSLSKGESLEETLENILAMQPDGLVIRFKGEPAVRAVCQGAQIPVINAGEGRSEHPTQALLDALTVVERRGQCAGEKILFVGDVQHSRVAASGLHVFKSLGAQIGFCAPETFWPKGAEWASAEAFSDLAQAASWATVCMGLRVQKERHEQQAFDRADYVARYRLDNKNLAGLNPQAVILHPGPFVPGEDLHQEILNDKRCAIHQQVANGVYVRMSVLGEIFGLFDS